MANMNGIDYSLNGQNGLSGLMINDYSQQNSTTASPFISGATSGASVGGSSPFANALNNSPSYDQSLNQFNQNTLSDAGWSGTENPLDSSGNGFGNNMQTWNTGLNALTGLGKLYLGYEAMNQQKDQFEFNKDLAQRNLANQAASYNEALGRRARTSSAMQENISPEQAKAEALAYLEQNKVSGKV